MTTRDKLDDVMGYLRKYKWSFRDLIRHIVLDNRNSMTFRWMKSMESYEDTDRLDLHSASFVWIHCPNSLCYQCSLVSLFGSSTSSRSRSASHSGFVSLSGKTTGSLIGWSARTLCLRCSLSELWATRSVWGILRSWSRVFLLLQLFCHTPFTAFCHCPQSTSIRSF